MFGSKILKVVRIGHPVLRKKCETVLKSKLTEGSLKQTIKNMIRTMQDYEGVGLAANQVALDMKLVVLRCQTSKRYPEAHDFPLEVWMNPKIIHYSKEKESDWEGCLSIPGYRGIVPRSKEVTFEALNPGGEKIRKTVNGFHARVIQHEIDHIHGLVYMKRMPDLKQWVHLETFNKLMHTRVQDRA